MAWLHLVPPAAVVLVAQIAAADVVNEASPEIKVCQADVLAQVYCGRVEGGVDWSEFLQLACTHCPEGRPCAQGPESAKLVEIAKQVAYLLEFKCLYGVLAANIVLAQFYDVSLAVAIPILRLSA